MDPITPRRALDEAFKMLDESLLDSTCDSLSPGEMSSSVIVAQHHSDSVLDGDDAAPLYATVNKPSLKAKLAAPSVGKVEGPGSSRVNDPLTAESAVGGGSEQPLYATVNKAMHAAVLGTEVGPRGVHWSEPSGGSSIVSGMGEEGMKKNPLSLETGQHASRSQQEVAVPSYAKVQKRPPQGTVATKGAVDEDLEEAGYATVSKPPSTKSKPTSSGTEKDLVEPGYSVITKSYLEPEYLAVKKASNETKPTISALDDDPVGPGYSRVGLTSVPKSNTWDKDAMKKGSTTLLGAEGDVRRKTSSANDVSDACYAEVKFPERISSPVLNTGEESGGLKPPVLPPRLGGKPFEPVFDDDWTRVCDNETSIAKLQASDMNAWREGGREGGREREREGGRERGREGEKEGGREGGGGREGEGESVLLFIVLVCVCVCVCVCM